jgi:hypothetical protein
MSCSQIYGFQPEQSGLRSGMDFMLLNVEEAVGSSSPNFKSLTETAIPPLLSLFSALSKTERSADDSGTTKQCNGE